MDSDSPTAECMAAEQPPLAGARFFVLGGFFGTKPEFAFPWSRRAAASRRSVPAVGRRHPREPLGHGPAA